MRRAILIAGVPVVILLILLLSLPALINANQFRSRIETELSSAVGRKITLGDVSFSLFSGSVRARGLQIADDARFGADPFLRATSLDLGVELMPLIFSHKLNVTDLTITEPQFHVVQDSKGVWNFSTLGSKAASAPPHDPSAAGASLTISSRLVRIVNGRVSLQRLGSAEKPTVLENVNIAINNFAVNTAFPFSLAAKLGKTGSIKLDGAAGPINPSDASLTPVQLHVRVSGVDLAASGVAATSGMSGLLSMDGTGNLHAATLDCKGLVRVDQARFVSRGTPARQTLEFDFAVQNDLQHHAGILRQGNIRFGAAHASLTGTYAGTGNVTALNLHLAGSAMPVSALTGMLPPLDIQLPAGSSLEGGTAFTNIEITGSASDPIVAGTAGLGGTTLKGFDLGSKIGAVEQIAGIEPARDTLIQTLSATFRSDASGTAIRDLRMVAPSIGDLDGGGSISAQHALDFKMRATVHTQGPFMAAVGQRHDTSIPFFVRGTATSPEFKPDVAAIAASEVQRLGGKNIRGVNVGKALNGLFGGKKK